MSVTLKVFAVLAAVAVSVAGCGTAGMPTTQVRPTEVGRAQSLTGLLEGFNQVHHAAFTKADANRDQQVDEFEAGPFIDVRDFRRADADRNGRLSEKEFMGWATRGGVLGLFNQDAKSFARAYRTSLLRAFKRLDTDRNQLLTPAEMNDGALDSANVALNIKGIKTYVRVSTLDEGAFRNADKTGDGFLSQGEFEDFAIAGWVALILAPLQPAPTEPGSVAEPASGE
ncbi:MAG: hypothetical protein VKN33_01215 [Candidatus Sericytochromatia bacterium]|nr:hypothetical protein [Candidatus Sericytochromatia bacterium]